MTHLKVAVRVRPLSKREIGQKSASVVEIGNNIVSVTNLKVPEQNAGDSRERVRRFSFDYCFDRTSTQQEIFQSIEGGIVNAVRKKYHSCILAYGQSSSGKTHTMMGSSEDPGLTPRLCESIFNYLHEMDVEEDEKRVTVSYLEIYNEKVNDLLISGDVEPNPLKVREHPNRGTYVQGLTERPVADAATLLHWLHVGNRNRRVSATSVNPKSSRSHSIFVVTCFGGVKLNLVDLAGSERTGSRTCTTSTFREGANINRSLVALGNVISALADQSTKLSRGFRKRFVPYRDSILTWLLKDTLGGNSKTVLIATISASSTCYSETVNTLRFGHRAKQIISQPMVNEDPRQKTIRELRAEVSRLRELLVLYKVKPTLKSGDPDTDTELHEGAEEIETVPVGKGNQTSESVFKKVTVDGSTNTEDFYIAANVKNFILEQFKNKSYLRDIERNFPRTNYFNFLRNNQCVVAQICKYLQTPNFKIYGNLKVSANTLSPPNNKICNVGSTLRAFFTLDRNFSKKSMVDVLCLKTEELLPVMDVNSDSTPEKPIVKLRRTFSVCSTDMDPKTTRLYGSHEALSSASGSKLEKIQKSQSTTLRKRSLDKSTTSIRNLILKKAQEMKPNADNAKGEGKSLAKVEAKVDSNRKASMKPRSEIVAAVTNRLYSKIKKKEVATETDDIQRENKGTLARLRLQDITQRALKAHRRRHVETQTDFSPILRVKEISTDVSDLKVVLVEVKHANVSTDQIQNKDISIDCNFLDNFENFDSRHSLKFTKSCGTQANGEEKTTTNLISFTKYLRPQHDYKFEAMNSITANPIYASSVNINVSHNYINGSKADSVSDDSLEDNSLNVCFPTPDLISNHNSLEPHVQESKKSEQSLAYATSDDIPEFTTNADYPQNKIDRVYVQSSVVSDWKERLRTVDVQRTYAPEICVVKTHERAKPFFIPKPQVLRTTATENLKSFNSVSTGQPVVLKSIMKQNQKIDYGSDSSDADVSLDAFEDVPDSLTYHVNKKVHFTQQPPENDRLFEVMTNFLKEATNLMTNLTLAASQLDKNSHQAFDMQITVNDLTELVRRGGRHRKRSRRRAAKKEEIGCQTCDGRESVSSQTSPKRTFEISTETDDVPENRFERMVQTACNRLERCADSKRQTWEKTSIFASSDAEHSSLQHEDSSLESNPTFSDYGSLPRRRVKNRSGYSPSAYLKQLTTMRKHIVDYSRDELINEAQTIID